MILLLVGERKVQTTGPSLNLPFLHSVDVCQRVTLSGTSTHLCERDNVVEPKMVSSTGTHLSMLGRHDCC